MGSTYTQRVSTGTVWSVPMYIMSNAPTPPSRFPRSLNVLRPVSRLVTCPLGGVGAFKMIEIGQ